MPKLIFKADDVRRVVEHSINAPKQGVLHDYSTCTKTEWKPKEVTPTEPHIILVHDQGVYLMSNGQPRDIIDEKTKGSFVAYAEGCHPKQDDDWYDTARDLVGGDDFGEHLPWAKEIKTMLDAGATHIIVNFSQRRLSLDARYPKGKAPKVASQPETPDHMVKRLQRMMKKKIVGLDTKRNTLVVYDWPPHAPAIVNIQKKQPEVRILNGQPTVELYKAVELHQQRQRA